MVRKLVFGESKYFNVKLDDERGGGNGEKDLKRNRKNVVVVTMQVRQSNCYCDKVTCVPTVRSKNADRNVNKLELYAGPQSLEDKHIAARVRYDTRLNKE